MSKYRNEIENLLKIAGHISDITPKEDFNGLKKSFQMNSRYQKFKESIKTKSKKFPKKDIYMFIHCLSKIRFDEEAIYWLITVDEVYGSNKEEKYCRFGKAIDRCLKICCLDYEMAEKVLEYGKQNMKMFEKELKEVLPI